ncbi:hypothetical protein GLAREA_00559 [Glarea lozoyensis ATCC 20868]|uniref:Uncharacterized protein n=1 Tax=Glarea lozoyensis (strain ATCC 20868 / MF5171) TaxID=1116229 RepID=S3CWS4_GLAL2|nr:uncharacterized protein GLAREA_00559 [Glarea lozoyensis ATCC 20868]EPE29399.1 hypothetical protein GLAREA_00559 [Glarea lozoyensis ATCC 20868]
MFSLLSTLSFFLTLTTALPTTTPASPVSARFAISVVTPNLPNLSLNVDPSGTVGIYKFILQRPTAYPGTPAYFQGTYLDFDTGEDSPYYMHIEDGEGVRDVLAIFGAGSGSTEYGLVGTKVNVTGEAAGENFLACETTAYEGYSILG